MTEEGINAVVLRGSMGAKELKLANEKLSDAQVIVATGNLQLSLSYEINRKRRKSGTVIRIVRGSKYL